MMIFNIIYCTYTSTCMLNYAATMFLYSTHTCTIPILIIIIIIKDWVYNQAVEQYILNADMALKLKKNNKQAFANIIKRSIEANGRGFWNADEDLMDKLKSMYLEVEADIEGAT